MSIGNNIVTVGVLSVAGYLGYQFVTSADDRRQQSLYRKKVNVDKSKLPNYSFAQVKAYAIKSQNGELYRWGSSQHLPVSIYNLMLEHNLKAIYWSPANVVSRAYKAMKGVQLDVPTTVLTYVSPLFSLLSTDSRDGIWEEIANLSREQLRELHNFWIDNAAESYSFYDWVDAEWSQGSTKTKLLGKLSAAGVGKYVNKD